MNSAAPSVAAARLAADELAAAGAGQVLLFGSVARGEGRPHSDIDLVAIFDDLDYSRRWNLRYELTRRAADACGHSVDVHVADRPELAVAETAELARRLAAAACSVAEIAVAAFETRQVAADLVSETGRIIATSRNLLNTTDLLTGAAI